MTERVLIVEDEALVALDIAAALGGSGYEVVGIAAGSTDAIALAERHEPSLAVVDVMLSDGIDGITVARELAQRFGTRIVFATANPDMALRDARDTSKWLVIKPYSHGELLRTVQQALA
ncbi:MAG: response regulator [Kiloniellales bacterium]